MLQNSPLTSKRLSDSTRHELKYSKLTHISDWKHMRDEWVGMKVNCTSTYGNILCGSGWLESEVHVKTLFWHMLFSHYAAKLSGWGSSGRRRRRSDWGRSQCLLSRKVRGYIQILFTCFSPSGSVKNVCIVCWVGMKHTCKTALQWSPKQLK